MCLGAAQKGAGRPQQLSYCVGNLPEIVRSCQKFSELCVFRRPPTIHTPHPQKASDLKVVFSRGWCTNCENLKEQQNKHYPRIASAMFSVAFCGGGARIVKLAFSTKPRAQFCNVVGTFEMLQHVSFASAAASACTSMQHQPEHAKQRAN